MQAKSDGAKRDEANTSEPEPPPEVSRGRQQVVATLVTLGGSFVLVTFLGGMPPIGLFVWIVVLGLLSIQMFRGTAWARFVLAVLAGLLAVGNGYQAVVSLGADGIGWAVNIGLALTYAWSAFMLSVSPAIRAFTDAQRASREAALEPPPK